MGSREVRKGRVGKVVWFGQEKIGARSATSRFGRQFYQTLSFATHVLRAARPMSYLTLNFLHCRVVRYVESFLLIMILPCSRVRRACLNHKNTGHTRAGKIGGVAVYTRLIYAT